MIETMPAELAENLIDFCENRSRVYALLSRCYETEIDAAFAEALAGEAALASDDAGLAAGFAALQADLAGCDEDALEQLAMAGMPAMVETVRMEKRDPMEVRG